MSGQIPTLQPQSAGEWQLYKVLQRANLLGYYDVFIEQGGDDVQQLCEADGEEFLEIMTLVGMATKPLHVRRLQKTLQEWVTRPNIFGVMPSVVVNSGIHPGPSKPTPQKSPTPPMSSASLNSLIGKLLSTPPGSVVVEPAEDIRVTPPPPMLDPAFIQAIAQSSANLMQYHEKLDLDELQVKTGKRVPKEVEELMMMQEDQPDRRDIIRKYSAIYGRFDSKRKPGKQLSQHEITVNEAAAQICSIDPTMIVRRDEMFPLARQVIKEAGYQYKKGNKAACRTLSLMNGSNGGLPLPYSEDMSPPSLKRFKSEIHDTAYEVSMSADEREKRLSELAIELSEQSIKQEVVENQMKTARLNNDIATLYNLQCELETITLELNALIKEQSYLSNYNTDDDVSLLKVKFVTSNHDE